MAGHGHDLRHDPIRKKPANGSMRCAASWRPRQTPRSLIGNLVDEAQLARHVSLGVGTPYVNTIPRTASRVSGDAELEARLRHYVRWNALAMSCAATGRAANSRPRRELRSAATLYDVGFITSSALRRNRSAATWCSFKATRRPRVARAFLEGRITRPSRTLSAEVAGSCRRIRIRG